MVPVLQVGRHRVHGGLITLQVPETLRVDASLVPVGKTVSPVAEVVVGREEARPGDRVEGLVPVVRVGRGAAMDVDVAVRRVGETAARPTRSVPSKRALLCLRVQVLSSNLK